MSTPAFVTKTEYPPGSPEIEKGVPLPSKSTDLRTSPPRHPKLAALYYPVRDMEVGDSVAFDITGHLAQTARVTIMQKWNRIARRGTEFTTRVLTEPGGVYLRIWRVA